MKPKRADQRMRVREIEVERLVVREPRGSRARAVIETGPPRPGMDKPDLPTVRLTLMDGRGNPTIVAEVDSEGRATLFVGGPDTGPMIAVTPEAVDVWGSGGSIVASVRSDDERGIVEVMKPRRRRRRPGK